MAKTSSKLIRTIPLSDTEVEALLDRLDNTEEEYRVSEAAKRRFSLRRKGCVLHIQQPGDAGYATYAVYTRAICEKGLTFLHGGFVHAGTKVVIQLISTRGSWTDVKGEVIHCRYLEKRVHEVGVRFLKRLCPSDYTTAAIEHRVLVVEDEDAIAELAMFHLKQLNAHVDRAEDGEAAIKMAMEKRYDLILCDMDMPVMNGFDAVAELRKRGYSGRVVAATVLTSSEDQARCLAVGCDSHLAKPYLREHLANLISDIAEEPLVSTFQDDEGMAPMIKEFVDSLRERVRAIEMAIMEKDAEGLERVVRSLRAEGSSYGFEPITASAEKVEKLLQEGGQLSDAFASVGELKKLCLLAQCNCESSLEELSEPILD